MKFSKEYENKNKVRNDHPEKRGQRLCPDIDCMGSSSFCVGLSGFIRQNIRISSNISKNIVSECYKMVIISIYSNIYIYGLYILQSCQKVRTFYLCLLCQFLPGTKESQGGGEGVRRSRFFKLECIWPLHTLKMHLKLLIFMSYL